MEAQKEMPRYKCHKEVWALKIAGIQPAPRATADEENDGSMIIIPENGEFAPFKVDRSYMAKHEPQPGGYYVVYDDGYQSYSPPEAFEAGYTLIG